MKLAKLKVLSVLILGLILFGVSSCVSSDVDDSTKTHLFAAVPQIASVGDTVSVYGNNFGANPKISIAGVDCNVTNVYADKVRFVVPACDGGLLELLSTSGKFSLKDFWVNTGVLIKSFYPQRITSGETVVVRGSGFDVNNIFKNEFSVFDGTSDVSAFKVISASKDSAVLISTGTFLSGVLKLKVGNKTNLSTQTISFVFDVRVDSIYPTKGGEGTLVNIVGVNFQKGYESKYIVSCGGTKLDVISITDSKNMVVKIPKDLNKFDSIKVNMPGNNTSTSKIKFKYAYGYDFVLGGAGILYDSQTLPITQAKTDSLIAMGVKSVTFSVSLADVEGFATGTLPASHVSFDNIVKIKQMSGNKINTILVLQHNKNLGTTYEKSSVASINIFLDNLKNYNSNGAMLWDNIDALQILYFSTSAGSTTATGVKDYVDKLLKPVWAICHPDGCSKKGEKLIFGLQAVAANNNMFLDLKSLQDAGYFDYVDCLSFMWNLSLVDTNPLYYARTVPIDAFDVRWLSQIEPIVKGSNMPFNAEINLNAATAPYAKVDELGSAIVYTTKKMKAYSGYKGFTYPKFNADNYGIRSSTDALDNRSTANKQTPQKTHYQMYIDIQNALK